MAKKNPVRPRVETFSRVLKESFHKNFPTGFISVQPTGGGGRSAEPHLYIQFSLLPKGAQDNGILENDPSYNTFMIYGDKGPFFEAGHAGGDLMSPKLKVEMIQGGRLWGPHGTNPEKVGWRNGTGTPDAILKKFRSYFEKLRSMVYARADAEGYPWDRNLHIVLQSNPDSPPKQGYRVAYLSGSGSGNHYVAVSTEVLTLENAKAWLRSLKRRGLTVWIETQDGEFFPVAGAQRDHRPDGWKRVPTTMSQEPKATKTKRASKAKRRNPPVPYEQDRLDDLVQAYVLEASSAHRDDDRLRGIADDIQVFIDQAQGEGWIGHPGAELDAIAYAGKLLEFNREHPRKRPYYSFTPASVNWLFQNNIWNTTAGPIGLVLAGMSPDEAWEDWPGAPRGYGYSRSGRDELLQFLDDVADGTFGWENMAQEDPSGRVGDLNAIYLNAGDSYAETLVINNGDSMVFHSYEGDVDEFPSGVVDVGSWAGILEAWEAEVGRPGWQRNEYDGEWEERETNPMSTQLLYTKSSPRTIPWMDAVPGDVLRITQPIWYDEIDPGEPHELLLPSGTYVMLSGPDDEGTGYVQAVNKDGTLDALHEVGSWWFIHDVELVGDASEAIDFPPARRAESEVYLDGEWHFFDDLISEHLSAESHRNSGESLYDTPAEDAAEQQRWKEFLRLGYIDDVTAGPGGRAEPAKKATRESMRKIKNRVLR